MKPGPKPKVDDPRVRKVALRYGLSVGEVRLMLKKGWTIRSRRPMWKDIMEHELVEP